MPLPEVRPETVDGPVVLGQELAFGFVAGVDIPELRRE